MFLDEWGRGAERDGGLRLQMGTILSTSHTTSGAPERPENRVSLPIRRVRNHRRRAESVIDARTALRT